MVSRAEHVVMYHGARVLSYEPYKLRRSQATEWEMVEPGKTDLDIESVPRGTIQISDGFVGARNKLLRNRFANADGGSRKPEYCARRRAVKEGRKVLTIRQSAVYPRPSVALLWL